MSDNSEAHFEATAGKYRVLVDGEEITDVCREAGDGEWWAVVYLLNKDGRVVYREDGTAARTIRRGRVEILSKEEGA